MPDAYKQIMSIDYFTKRYHAPGTAPGTLVPSGDEEKRVELKITLIDFSESDFQEVDLATTDECREYLSLPSNTWIHIQGHAAPDTLRELGGLFGLHPLALEDVLNIGQRPKAETECEFASQLISTTIYLVSYVLFWVRIRSSNDTNFWVQSSYYHFFRYIIPMQPNNRLKD